jgi:hypothetical protein
MVERPHPPSVSKESEFAATVLIVLFSLTFEKALQTSLGGIAHYRTTWQVNDAFVAQPFHYISRLLQLAAFLLTLFRFYAGAYRFNIQSPPSKGVWPTLWNLTNTTLLFVGFYVAALLVATRGVFALFVALFHVVDLGWFRLGGSLLRGDRALETIKDEYVRFDVITIASFALIGLAWWTVRFDTKWVQLVTSALLMTLFYFDVLVRCRDFYFRPEIWMASFGVSRQSDGATEQLVAEHVAPVLYFAGPLFTQGERSWNAAIVGRLRSAGFEVLLPQEQAATIVTSTTGLSPDERSALFRVAVESVDRSDVVVAVLDGPDADSGTCFECGYAYARNKSFWGFARIFDSVAMTKIALSI